MVYGCPVILHPVIPQPGDLLVQNRDALVAPADLRFQFSDPSLVPWLAGSVPPAAPSDALLV